MPGRLESRFIFLLLTAIALSFLPGSAFSREIVGYFPNWRVYDRGFIVNPETIRYEKYTVINYAFFRPLPGGRIASTDSLADEVLLLGPRTENGGNDFSRSLPALARGHGVKLLASVGGWNDSANFPAIAASPSARKNFAEHCARLIESYGFDGIDIDWEYPGYGPHGGSPADRENFTLLLWEVRRELDSLGRTLGRRLLLTACFGASRERFRHIEWGEVAPLLDMINLMTYDFAPRGGLSGHNAPLYSPEGDRCVDGAFRTLTRDFGVPPGKVNIGLAFYGKAFADCGGAGMSFSGYDAGTFPEDGGRPPHYAVEGRIYGFDYYFDDEARVPYLVGKGPNTFVTYDDVLSITEKARYALKNRAMGVFIWELTGDYSETYPGSGEISGTPLVDAVNKVLEAGSGGCFVASSVYGDRFSPEVCSLRIFRDDLVLQSAAGRLLAKAYVAAGPGLAGFFEGRALPAAVFRVHLSPAVRLARFMYCTGRGFKRGDSPDAAF